MLISGSLRYTRDSICQSHRTACHTRSHPAQTVRNEIRSDPNPNPHPNPNPNKIRSDLIGYVRDRQIGITTADVVNDRAELDLLRVAVFSLGLVSSFVESLFSKMVYNHNQSKIRSSLQADAMSAILHVHDSVLPDPRQPLDGTLTLRLPPPVKDRKEMEKHLRRPVCDVFENADGEDQRFHGTVTALVEHEVHRQWMYHVVYSDHDSVDYW